MSEVLIGKGGRGIPASIFDQTAPFSGEIWGGSGKKLTVNIQPNEVVIKSTGRDDCLFSARLDPEGNLLLAVRTVINKTIFGKEKRHPDLFAGMLVRKAIGYFGKQGHSVIRIQGCWQGPRWGGGENINYKLFNQSLAKGLSEEEAAFSTWTGRLAQELGFSTIKRVHIIPARDRASGQVTVTFAKM